MFYFLSFKIWEKKLLKNKKKKNLSISSILKI